MVKKTLGYVELEWTCPSCGARNPGAAEKCQSCGMKMPEDVEFELPVKQELDTSAEAAARVAAGPDIHCPYCGARNPGNATSCVQCGGDLSEGAKRKKGKVLGAYQDGPVPDVTCPHCGASNPGTATKCSSCGGNLEREKPTAKPPSRAPQKKAIPLVGLILVALLCIVGAFFLLRGSSESVALVQKVEWTYRLGIEELKPATHEAWRDEVPKDAQLGSCKSKIRRTEQEPVAGATEVCGTPYVEDTGTGQGAKVQDCEYHVPDDWCEYTVDEWQAAEPVVKTGHNLNPTWPALNLKSNQREGERSEEYKVILDADGKNHVYSPDSVEEFKKFEIDSKWLVETNALGGVTSVQPAD